MPTFARLACHFHFIFLLFSAFLHSAYWVYCLTVAKLLAGAYVRFAATGLNFDYKTILFSCSYMITNMHWCLLLLLVFYLLQLAVALPRSGTPITWTIDNRRRLIRFVGRITLEEGEYNEADIDVIVTKVKLVRPSNPARMIVFVNEDGDILSTLLQTRKKKKSSKTKSRTTTTTTTTTTDITTSARTTTEISRKAPDVAKFAEPTISNPPTGSRVIYPPNVSTAKSKLPEALQRQGVAPPIADSEHADARATRPPGTRTDERSSQTYTSTDARSTPSKSEGNKEAATESRHKTSSSAYESDAPASTHHVNSGFGFTYSPIDPDGSCKNQAQVDSDIAAIPADFSLIRLYGIDCDQLSKVARAAQTRGYKIFAGVTNITVHLEDELAEIARVAKQYGGWDMFDTISIGNELIQMEKESVDTVMGSLRRAKKLLREKYDYPKDKAIVVVDTLEAARRHPQICDESDYCAVNSHPFFDGNVPAEKSGDFLVTQVASLRPRLKDPKKEIIITETGWPSDGKQHGAAKPGVLEQQDALKSIMQAFTAAPADVILFSAYNGHWKKNTDHTFMTEQYWGFLGDAKSDPKCDYTGNRVKCYKNDEG